MFEGKMLHVMQPNVAQRVAVVFAAFMTWSALFLFVYSRPTSQRLASKAVELNTGIRTHRAVLATNAVATVHATIVAIGASSLVFFRKDSNLYVKLDKFTDPLSWPKFDTFNEDAIFYACISAGFFIADFILCVVQYQEQGLQFVVHAAAGLSGTVYCLYSGEGLLYLMLLMLFEMSTPFLHIRWWCDEYGFKKSWIYLVNGLMLVGMYTVFRLVIGIPVLLRMVYELHTLPEKNRHGYLMRFTFTLAPLTMVFLNSLWGFKLWKGFLRAIGILPASSRKPRTVEEPAKQE